jgi:LAO/AO transport system kinase
LHGNEIDSDQQIETTRRMKEQCSIEETLVSLRLGDKRTASQLMSLIENDGQRGDAFLREMSVSGKRAFVLGVTGWPGVGKSTIVSQLTKGFLRDGKDVGVIVIDPSSPFSGGSLLGDRERMKGVDGDPKLFIRSAATRGHAGGIARSARAFVKVMEEMGKEIVIVETVGVGQDQVSIMQMAHTILLILIPGMGDYLQSLKAGILEIGDIFVVNKADREGANQAVADLTMMISMNGMSREWRPPIVKTIARNGTGIEELMTQVELHRKSLENGTPLNLRQMSAIRTEILENISSQCLHHIAQKTDLNGLIEEYVQKVHNGALDSQTVAEEILRKSGIA